MPKAIIFNNRTVVEPGAYPQSKGGEKQAPDTASFGNVVIIDTGNGAGYGGGSGINGTHFSKKKSVYGFDNLEDFRLFVRGGEIWDIARKLFRPSNNPTVKGCDLLYIIRAATTVSSEIIYSFVGGGPNGGTVTIKPLSEGVGSNGVKNVTSNELVKGYGAKMIAGIDDPAKFILQFYVGNFRGTDADGDLYDGIAEVDSLPTLLAQTPEFTNVSELITFFKNDVTFNTYFKDGGTAAIGTGVVDAADLAANSSLKLAVNGTTVYGATDFDDVLESIAELDNTFFLCTDFGVVNGKGTKNSKLFQHILTEAVNEKFMIVGGGKDSTEFDQAASSFDLAGFYNSSRAHVVHGDILKTITTGSGFKRLTSLYHAATYCGRLAGLEPQNPATWKDLDIDGQTHELTLKERNKALKKGVVHLKEVEGQLVVNQEVNTLQQNDLFVYPDGQSPEGSVMRISALLNKEIKLNLERRGVGRNVNTSSPADVKSNIEDILIARTATKTADNLILSYRDIKVKLTGTDFKIEYGYVPNGPINRFFVTGFIFSPNLSA